MPIRTCVALFAALLTLSLGRSAPPPNASSCDAPETRQFDFWVGTWALSWGDDGHGTNRIRRILGGCVIEESFAGQMATGPYHGRSFTVYDTSAGVWRQTWVDDNGAYLDFEGGMRADGRMVLARTTTRNGQTVYQRMVWRDVETDRLHWDWQQSTDGGTTWTTRWSIEYVRSE